MTDQSQSVAVPDLRRIHDLLDQAQPDRRLLRDADGRAWTYGQMADLSRQMAARLQAHGIRAGDRVMILSENCATYLAAVMAVSRLDAWALLVNARLTAAEVDRLAQVAGIRSAIFTPELSPASADHAERLGAVSLGALDCGDLRVLPIRDAVAEPVEDGPEQTAVLIYTTGTVGEPKGVMLTHRNLLFMSDVARQLRRITVDDVTLAVLPGTHIFGLTSVILGALAQQSQLVMMPRFDAQLVLDQLARGVTILPAVPQIFAALLKHLNAQGQAPCTDSLRYIYAGGAPLDPGLKQRVEKLFGLVLHNGYGQTEASPGIAVTRMDAPRSDSSVGVAVPGTELTIHQPDENGVGELWTRGPHVMKGYYGNPAATAQTVMADGFLRTGDLARQDPDGAVHLVGRLKELIVRSGFNVYPPEVEAVLTDHPAVTICGVVGRAVPGDEEVTAFVTTHAPVTEDELRDWARARMAPYKVPSRILIAEALPQAATGKILKSKLLDHFRSQLEEKETH